MKRLKWIPPALVAIGLAITLIVLNLNPLSIRMSEGIVSISVAQAQIASPLQITYPPEADTDTEKLYAVYSLVEQMRLEHNYVGSIARSDWEKYQGNWVEYSKIFKVKQLELLREQNRLRDAIRKVNYTDDDWQKLTDTERMEAFTTLYGDRETLKVLPTLASASVLDELKALKLIDLKGQFVDPTEDFTGYTEVDEDSDITVTASKVDVVTMRNDAFSHVYTSYGAGHFGTVQHLLTLSISAMMTACRAGYWGLTNTNYTIVDMETNDEGIVGYITQGGGGDWRVYLKLPEGGSDSIDYYTRAAGAVTLYLTVDTGDAACTNKIYSDDARTNLLDTISVAGLGVNTFSTVIAVCSQSGTSQIAQTATYYVENLDLQEAGDTYDITNDPSSKAFGTILASTAYYAKGTQPNNPVQDGDCTFTLTSTGSAATDIDIHGHNSTGGAGMTLVSGAPGAAQFRITSYYTGQNPASGVVLTTSDQEFYDNLASSGHIHWDFKLEIGSSGPPEQQTTTTTLTGRVHS